ncbi:hypothetical protein JEQ12_019677 [Ovis aries]|uniref:Uncharacterized protein n=1 Tax=Ovis aries TaxID=9940 RepID=A0A836CRW3_SHEEP|nr:hypothetical protein JEQ12_019677 [Ovis aries]
MNDANWCTTDRKAEQEEVNTEVYSLFTSVQIFSCSLMSTAVDLQRVLTPLKWYQSMIRHPPLPPMLPDLPLEAWPATDKTKREEVSKAYSFSSSSSSSVIRLVQVYSTEPTILP